ncbi:MAG: HNH endonuclease [Bacteroidales bacterium]|nr:HNH endonuclease [Bacteroidales bacterium]
MDKHDGSYQRDRSASPYHSYRWTRLSRVFRAQHPLCEECRRRGIIKAAEVVDHIIPYPVCKDFYDTKNLQSLCAECNVEKGNRDKRVIKEWRKTHTKNK